MGLQIGAGDLNPSMAAIPERTTCLWRSRERTTWFWGAPFCHVASAAGEMLPGRKGEKGLLLVGHEKVPHGSGLTGDCSGDTADGAQTEGLPEPWTSTSFPEVRYPGLGLSLIHI